MSAQTILLTGKHGRDFLADIYGGENLQAKAVVIFSHGFKGFKDWGTFPAIAEHFANRGIVYMAFNFSHNGTTIEQPTEFADLEAFGNDNFTKSLDDLGVVIDWAANNFNTLPIYLLGHSRGGGISMLKAYEDARVRKVAVWGSVNQFGRFWKNDEMERMKRYGVIYVPNARTNQQMPIYKQLYEDLEINAARLDIPTAIKNMQQSLLVVHGTNDETIPYTAAEEMKAWNSKVQLVSIENGNHTFGAKHPWVNTELPPHTLEAVSATADFFIA